METDYKIYHENRLKPDTKIKILQFRDDPNTPQVFVDTVEGLIKFAQVEPMATLELTVFTACQKLAKQSGTQIYLKKAA